MVNNNTDIFWDLIMDVDINLVCIAENWLDEVGGVNLHQLCPPGFQILQQPQLQGQRGKSQWSITSPCPLPGTLFSSSLGLSVCMLC